MHVSVNFRHQKHHWGGGFWIFPDEIWAPPTWGLKIWAPPSEYWRNLGSYLKDSTFPSNDFWIVLYSIRPFGQLMATSTKLVLSLYQLPSIRQSYTKLSDQLHCGRSNMGILASRILDIGQSSILPDPDPKRSLHNLFLAHTLVVLYT